MAEIIGAAQEPTIPENVTVSTATSVKEVVAAKVIGENLSKISSMMGDANADTLIAAVESAENIGTAVIHFHRPPMRIALGNMSSVISGLSEELSTFVDRRSDAFSLKAFTDESKKLKSIEELIRRKLAGLCIGGSDYITSEDFYGTFLPFLREKVEEYNNVRATIETYYEAEMAEYEARALDVIRATCPKKESEVLRVLDSFTSRNKESFVAAICYDIDTSFDERGCLNADEQQLLKDAKRAYAERQAQDLFVGLLRELYNGVGHYTALIKDAPEVLSGYPGCKKGLKELADKVSLGNPGGAFPVITKMTDGIRELSKEESRDLANNRAFDILSEVVGLADTFGVTLSPKEKWPEWTKDKATLLEVFAANHAA